MSPVRGQAMIVLHGLKACDSCRAALRELKAAGQEARLRDLRADPPSREEVAAWSQALGPALTNRRSTTWRGLSEAERDGDPVALMTAHPTLIKRPVVGAPGGDLHLGWTAEVRAELGV